MPTAIITSPSTLSPLPSDLTRGLTAVSVLGFLSFLTSTALFVRLAYRLLTSDRHQRHNQFLILIFNLLFADIQQSIAFLLNAQWLRSAAIDVATPTCWAQGWFVSTGDLASGVFTLAIAVHCFADIVFNYRLGPRTFLASIVFLWVFNYACAIIGVALHPADFYVRAGAWCWINAKYSDERLWLHYFWILIAEFGTVALYSLIFLILRRRVKEAFYTTSETALRARSAARLIIAYPIVYVVCTLPLVTARLTSMAGGRVTFVELCVAGAMITSNGWLDVLLYSLTRRALLFGTPLPSPNAGALETFRLRPDQAFGTVTTIEALSRGDGGGGGGLKYRPNILHTRLGSRHGSQEGLFDLGAVKAETVVRVNSECISPEQALELAEMRKRPSMSDEAFVSSVHAGDSEGRRASSASRATEKL